MRIWYSNDHEGHYPVGVASVVVAEDEDEARDLLILKLREHGLEQKRPFRLTEIKTDQARAIVINDGDY